MSELLANSPTVGIDTPIATLAAPIATLIQTAITTSGPAESTLQGGQFRALVGTLNPNGTLTNVELVLVTAGQNGTGWTIVRGPNLAEPDTNTAQLHEAGDSIWHVFSAGGLEAVMAAYAAAAAAASDPAGSAATALTAAESFATGAAAAAQAAAEAASVPTSELGAANGVATLDSGQHLTSSQVPSSVVSASAVAAGLIPKANGSSGVVWANSDLTVPVFYVADYGTITYGFQSSVDNAATIQAAINAAEAYTASGGSGAIVQLPAAAVAFQTTLTITGAIWLRGAGIGGSVLYAFWGAQTTPNIHLTSAATGATLTDFRLGVNKSTAKSTAHGIQVDGQGGFASSGGSGVTIQRVWVATASGDGVNLAGIEQRLINVYVQQAAGAGFSIAGTDNMITNCTADTCGSQGFTVLAPNNKFTGCKAFGCASNGWNVGAQRNMFVSCEAQDNGAYGFNVIQGSNVLAGCLADTNGRNGGTQYGFFFNDDNNAVGLNAINRTGSYQTYNYGAQNAGSPGVSVSSIQGSSQLPGTSHVDPAAVGSFNINNSEGPQTVAYATAITPDPYLGGMINVGSLTGALTINATTYAPYTGQRVQFVLPQDATGGRVVTFNAIYQPIAAIPATPSRTTVIQFAFNGTAWIETSRNNGDADDSYGFPTTWPFWGLTQTAAVLNNRIYAARVVGSGLISHIQINVAVQSGNICVGVYPGRSVGIANNGPGTRIATSGSVSCPGTGFQSIALTGPVQVLPGDWFAIMADNNTASFMCAGNGSDETAAPSATGATAAFTGVGGNTLPLPSSLPLTVTESKVYYMVGVT